MSQAQKVRPCKLRERHESHEWRGKQTYLCYGYARPDHSESFRDAEICEANAQAREWKALFLRALGITDPWAITTWTLARAAKELEVLGVRGSGVLPSAPPEPENRTRSYPEFEASLRKPPEEK